MFLTDCTAGPEVAKQMGMWLTGSDDALIAHLLERDSYEES